MTTSDLPSQELLVRQAERLSALRGRILRRLGVARLGPVLDLGAGHGALTSELVRRSRGGVVALDRRRGILGGTSAFDGAHLVVGDGKALPFSDECFDLVVVQLVFLWERDHMGLALEIARVLRPSGTLLAVEPDFGGLIEWPGAISLRDIWLAALCRAGADPLVGRKLAGVFESAGLRSRVDLFSAPSPPDSDRFELLAGLPMTETEKARLEACRRADSMLEQEKKMVHLPFFFVSGSKRP